MVISGDILSGLCKSCQFRPPEKGPYIIFAIRGCLPEAVLRNDFTEVMQFRESYLLREVKVDYQTARCTVGLWDTALNKIALFAGSTLPSRSYLFAHKSSLATFNVLCSGLYELRRGLHPRSGSGVQKHEALLMDGSGMVKIPVVKRLKRTVQFETRNCTYKVLLPGDNLHAARTAPSFISNATSGCSEVLKMKYSSSGCITIAGQPEGCVKDLETKASWNCWQTFMHALNDVKGQTDFNFILFSCSDVRSLNRRAARSLMRYGSESGQVSQLQHVLRSVTEMRTGLPYYQGNITGVFADQTAAAFLQFQKDFTNRNIKPEIRIKEFLRRTKHFNLF